MANHEARDLESMSPILTRSATRSGKVRRSLDPELASNSIQKTALDSLDNILIFLVGEESNKPEDLFWFITTREIKNMPDFLSAEKPLTAAQRMQAISLVGKCSGETAKVRIFCRVEEGKLNFYVLLTIPHDITGNIPGIDEKFVCHNYEKITELFTVMHTVRGNKAEAYHDCILRFPEAMRSR